MATLGQGRALLPLNRKQNKSNIPMPKTAAEWDKLMRVVIAKAEEQGDRRIHGLRAALAQGRSERMLRMMHIIHTGDLHREFPTKA